MESQQLGNKEQFHEVEFDFEQYLKELNLDESMTESKDSVSQEQFDDPQRINPSNIQHPEPKKYQQTNNLQNSQQVNEQYDDEIDKSKISTQDKNFISSQLIQSNLQQQQDKIDISKIQSVILEVQQQKQILRELNTKQQQVYNDIKQHQIQEYNSMNLDNSNYTDQSINLNLSQSLNFDTQPTQTDEEEAIQQTINTLIMQIQSMNDIFIQQQTNSLIDQLKFQLNVQKQLSYTFLPGNIKNTKLINNQTIQMYYIFSDNLIEAEEVLVRFFIQYLNNPNYSKNKSGAICIKKINQEINFSAVNFRIKHFQKRNISILFNQGKNGIYIFQILDHDTNIECKFEIIGGIIQNNIYYILDNTSQNRALVNQSHQPHYREYSNTLVVIYKK